MRKSEIRQLMDATRPRPQLAGGGLARIACCDACEAGGALCIDTCPTGALRLEAR